MDDGDVMSKPIKNIALSKHRKLLHIAQTNHQDFNSLHRRYLQERFLYRISQSKYKDNFILKGGLLLITIDLPSARPTMDIDFLARHISRDKQDLKTVFKDICSLDIDDGITFDGSSITTEEIDKDGDYNGTRVKFTAIMGTSKIPISIDLGFSDVLIPEPRKIKFPTILEEDSPYLQAYCLETIIAEKFEAVTKLALTNNRMKDFYDLYMILTEQQLNTDTLKKAIKDTFENRKTQLIPNPIAFTSTFYADADKQRQWETFLNKRNIQSAPNDLQTIVKMIKEVLTPLVKEINWPANY